jgi:DnaJ-class molecular chaperone
MKADLYKTLGVGLDADQPAIRRAYRKAAKHAHPDIPGGSDSRFALVKAAYDTLGDEARRRRYDETGEVDDKPVDNKRAHAMQCLSAGLEAAIGSCDANGEDPETVDLPKRIRSWIENQIRETRRNLEKAQKGLKKNEAIAKRFTDDVMVQIMQGRIAAWKERTVHMRRNVEMGEDALALLADIQYRLDEPEPMQGITSNPVFNQMFRRF